MYFYRGEAADLFLGVYTHVCRCKQSTTVSEYLTTHNGKSMQITESRKRRAIIPAVIPVTKVRFGRSSHRRIQKCTSTYRLEKETGAGRRVCLKVAESWLLET